MAFSEGWTDDGVALRSDLRHALGDQTLITGEHPDDETEVLEDDEWDRAELDWQQQRVLP